MAAEPRLAVKQQIERLEAFTGIETTNAYAVLDGAGNVLLHAEEEAGWSGLAREIYTDADNFGIEFPPDLTPQMKAVLLGALLLIDFVHFDDR